MNEKTKYGTINTLQLRAKLTATHHNVPIKFTIEQQCYYNQRVYILFATIVHFITIHVTNGNFVAKINSVHQQGLYV